MKLCFHNIIILLMQISLVFFIYPLQSNKFQANPDDTYILFSLVIHALNLIWVVGEGLKSGENMLPLGEIQVCNCENFPLFIN